MRLRLVTLVSVPLLAAFVVVAACSNEGEGEPCDPDNGNNDCQDGYACVVPPNPNATNAPHVCCPGEGQSPTTPECTVNGNVKTGDASPPPDSALPESATAADSHVSETSAEGSSADGPAEGSSGGDASDGGGG